MSKGTISFLIPCVLCLSSCIEVHDRLMDACGICNQGQVDFLQQVSEGNIDTLQVYLESGGDPEFECHNILHGRIFLGNTESLYGAIVYSSFYVIRERSFEMIKTYLYYHNTQQAKDNLLYAFVYSDTTATLKMGRFLVNKGGRFFLLREDHPCLMRFWEDWVFRFHMLYDVGYDFNKQNEKGETLLMQFVNCTSESREEAAGHLKLLQFLLDHGARTDIKNNEGKTASDLAVDPKVKEFLKSAERSGKQRSV